MTDPVERQLELHCMTHYQLDALGTPEAVAEIRRRAAEAPRGAGERAAHANGYEAGFAAGKVVERATHWGWTLNHYQAQAAVTSGPVPKNDYVRLLYSAAKLSGEAGEVTEKIAKAYRDDNSVVTPQRREAILLEIGDVLWYLSDIARRLDYSLEEVALANIGKIRSREARGVMHGDGDNR